jgi:hypothetical protein
LLSIFDLPEVNFSELEDETICLEAGLILLTAEPDGGAFTGPGILGLNIDPIEAGEGEHTLYYTYMDENGCSAADSIIVRVVDCLGIHEQNKYQITLHPNPFDDFTVLNFGNELTEPHSIFIYDILGQVVYQNENLTGSSMKIESKNLVPGSYILSLFNENSTKIFTTKLMVE